MNQTINISLPVQLKAQANVYIKDGLYSSFSDLVRTALRSLLAKSKYEIMAEKVKKEYDQGKAVVIDNQKQLDDYLDSII